MAINKKTTKELEFKSLLIKYKEDVNLDEKSIIEDYWKYEYPYYKSVNLDELTKKYSYSRREITDLIRAKCYVELYCHKCACFMGKFGNKSELQVERFYERGSIVCDECWLNIREPIYKEIIREVPKYVKVEGDIEDKLSLGIKTEKWRQLNQIELEILIRITENTGKKDILSAVFIDQDWRSEHNEKYWNILSKLDKMNLIYIERVSQEDRKIVGIHYHGSLWMTLKENYPKLFLRQEKIDQLFIPINLKVDKLFKRINDNQPDYSTVFRNTTNRFLKKGHYYQFSAWENTDWLSIKLINLKEDEINKLNLLIQEEE